MTHVTDDVRGNSFAAEISGFWFDFVYLGRSSISILFYCFCFGFHCYLNEFLTFHARIYWGVTLFYWNFQSLHYDIFLGPFSLAIFAAIFGGIFFFWWTHGYVMNIQMKIHILSKIFITRLFVHIHQNTISR